VQSVKSCRVVFRLGLCCLRPRPVIHYTVWSTPGTRCSRDWTVVDRIWNVMAHVQKPDFVFRRNGRVHLNRRGRQFSRLLVAEVCASAVVMLDILCSEVVWRVLVTRSIRQFPLHFPSRASSCVITFQLGSTSYVCAPVYFRHALMRRCVLKVMARSIVALYWSKSLPHFWVTRHYFDSGAQPLVPLSCPPRPWPIW